MIIKSAIVLELSGKMEKLARIAWGILSKELNINYISDSSPCPHIAIEYGFSINNDDLLCQYLQDSKATFKPFQTSGIGLGVFIKQTSVIYIRWSRNYEFETFRKKMKKILNNANSNNIINSYEQDENWLPKTTLAFNDTDYNRLNIVLD